MIRYHKWSGHYIGRYCLDCGITKKEFYLKGEPMECEEKLKNKLNYNTGWLVAAALLFILLNVVIGEANSRKIDFRIDIDELKSMVSNLDKRVNEIEKMEDVGKSTEVLETLRAQVNQLDYLLKGENKKWYQ